MSRPSFALQAKISQFLFLKMKVPDQWLSQGCPRNPSSKKKKEKKDTKKTCLLFCRHTMSCDSSPLMICGMFHRTRLLHCGGADLSPLLHEMGDMMVHKVDSNCILVVEQTPEHKTSFHCVQKRVQQAPCQLQCFIFPQCSLLHEVYYPINFEILWNIAVNKKKARTGAHGTNEDFICQENGYNSLLVK